MDLVAQVQTGDVDADQGAPGQTERLAGLLTHVDARGRHGGTVAHAELLRVGEGLDGCAVLLRRREVGVLDVVRVVRAGLSAGRRLRDGRQTVPRNTGVVRAGLVREEENAMVDSGLEDLLANAVPLKNW